MLTRFLQRWRYGEAVIVVSGLPRSGTSMFMNMLQAGGLPILTDAVRDEGTTTLLSSHIVTDVEQACDRLIVLGVGQVLLHDSVANALAGHAISTSERTDAVAAFAAADGSLNWLVRGSADRPATLEEVVLGYLASSRTSAVAA